MDSDLGRLRRTVYLQVSKSRVFAAKIRGSEKAVGYNIISDNIVKEIVDTLHVILASRLEGKRRPSKDFTSDENIIESGNFHLQYYFEYSPCKDLVLPDIWKQLKQRTSVNDKKPACLRMLDESIVIIIMKNKKTSDGKAASDDSPVPSHYFARPQRPTASAAKKKERLKTLSKKRATRHEKQSGPDKENLDAKLTKRQLPDSGQTTLDFTKGKSTKRKKLPEREVVVDVLDIDAAPKRFSPLQQDSVLNVKRRPASANSIGDCIVTGGKKSQVVSVEDTFTFDWTSLGSITEIDEATLRGIVRNMESDLRLIFQGKLQSTRHDEYKTGMSSKDSLNLQVRFGEFSEEQSEVILGVLTEIFCSKNTRYFDYVIKVLLPETLARIYCNWKGVSMEKAELMLAKEDDDPSQLEDSFDDTVDLLRGRLGVNLTRS